MNKKQLILLCMLAAGGSIQAQQWPDAPAEARPGTRWWWLGSAVDEKNLTYNLEEYARAGMGASVVPSELTAEARHRLPMRLCGALSNVR